jgi:hypothetical protein
MVVVFFISNADEAKEAFYGYVMLRGHQTSAGHVAWPALSSSCAEPPVCCLHPHLYHSRGRCAILELFFPAFLRCVSGRVIYGSTIWLSAWIWLVTISTQIREIGDFFCAVSPSQIPSHQNMVVWLKFFLKPGLDDLAVCRSCIFVGCWIDLQRICSWIFLHITGRHKMISHEIFSLDASISVISIWHFHDLHFFHVSSMYEKRSFASPVNMLLKIWTLKINHVFCMIILIALCLVLFWSLCA